MVFTIFSLKNSKNLDDIELAYLRKMLAAYSVTNEGLWLQTLPWTKMEFYWCPSMTVENGVMGCFSPIYGDKIFLQPFDYNGMSNHIDGRVNWIEQLFITIIHELRHAYQWKRSKIGYIICALPILRQFTLEVDANAEQKKATPFAEKWEAKQDYIAASKRGLVRDPFTEEEADQEKEDE